LICCKGRESAKPVFPTWEKKMILATITKMLYAYKQYVIYLLICKNRQIGAENSQYFYVQDKLL
jgi:hypothetical protein